MIIVNPKSYKSKVPKSRPVYTSQFCPKPNLIKDKIPVLELDIVERQYLYCKDHLSFNKSIATFTLNTLTIII